MLLQFETYSYLYQSTVCWDQVGGPRGRYREPLQRPAWIPLSSEQTGGRFTEHRDMIFPETSNRYVDLMDNLRICLILIAWHNRSVRELYIPKALGLADVEGDGGITSIGDRLQIL